jgi:hypothetical protein
MERGRGPPRSDGRVRGFTLTVFAVRDQERGDKARCIPGEVEAEFHDFNALELSSANLSSEI